MTAAREAAIAALAAILGGLVYVVPAFFAERNLLDGSPFFQWLMGTLALPLILGMLFPRRAWLVGMYTLVGQVAYLAVAEAGDSNQLPIGVVLYLMLAIPMVGLGALGGYLRGRLRASK